MKHRLGGRPAVANLCGGPGDCVRDGEGGCLAEFFAAEAADRLSLIERDRLARDARATVEVCYSSSSVREIFGAASDELGWAKKERNNA